MVWIACHRSQVYYEYLFRTQLLLCGVTRPKVVALPVSMRDPLDLVWSRGRQNGLAGDLDPAQFVSRKYQSRFYKLGG